MIPSHIFREYDIRGEVDKELTAPVVEAIGRSFATYLLRTQRHLEPTTLIPTLTVGRDVRLHSDRMKEALVKGICSTGIHVIDVGVCPTPVTYFSIHHFSRPLCTEIPPVLPDYETREILGGVMITGSHNPPEFNGFKMCAGKTALHGEAIQEVRRIAQELMEGGTTTGDQGGAAVSGRNGDSAAHSVLPTGGVVSYDILTPYYAYLRDQFVSGGTLADAGGAAAASKRSSGAPILNRDWNKIKLVVDSGNGTAGVIAPKILRDMGCEVIDLFSEPDGNFPNHHPDPTVEENLRDLVEMVRKQGAHVGVAYDGDADRIGVVDESGEVIWGDRLMIIYARDILMSLPGAVMVSEVKASQVLFDEIEKAGGKPIMWKAGHSLIKAKMRETNAALGGEVSGHVFFADRYFGFDDAIYATCRLVEILQKTTIQDGYSLHPKGSEKKWGVSQLLRGLPETLVTPEIRVSCPDDQKFLVVERLKASLADERLHPVKGSPVIKDLVTVDGIRVIFEKGWGLVRPSNTQPVLVLRFEADSAEQLKVYQEYVESRLKSSREG